MSLRPTDDHFVEEDTMPRVDLDEEDGPDDSDITPAEVVADVIGEKPRRNVIRQKDGGGLSSAADTDDQENMESAIEAVEDEGRGKRKRKENQLYVGWWRHEAKDGKDMPGEPGMDVGVDVDDGGTKRGRRKQNGSKWQART
jgi:hypothetical protein